MKNSSFKTTRLLIARHGNTFLPTESPRRVGGRTDLPLVETHKAKAIGLYLQEQFTPHLVYSSPLKRTLETTEIALATAGMTHLPIISADIFKEIDYGPDENKTEAEVVQRLGQTAIDDWNNAAQVPSGWLVEPQKIKRAWREFCHELIDKFVGQNILVVTSNGVARFAPAIVDNPVSSNTIKDLKIKTGHICLFETTSEPLNTETNNDLKPDWQCIFWNKKP